MAIISSKDLSSSPDYYTLLVLGTKRIGKSTMIISTAPQPVLVVVFESDDSLAGPKKVLRSKKQDFDLVRVTPPRSDSAQGSWESMLNALRDIRRAVEAKRYKTVVFDSISVFGGMLEREITALPIYHAGGTASGPLIIQSAYGDIARKSDHLFSQMGILSRWANVIATMHYTESEKKVGEQTPKYGEGYVPLWPGQFREKIGLHFTNIVWMDARGPEDVSAGNADQEVLEPPYNGRVFVTGERGGWGPGCRAWAGNYVVPADVGRLFDRFDEEVDTDPTATPAVKLRPRGAGNRPAVQNKLVTKPSTPTPKTTVPNATKPTTTPTNTRK